MRPKHAPIALAVSALIHSTPSLAEEQGVYRLDNVTVIASSQQQGEALDTPQAVNEVTQDDVAKQSPVNLPAAIKRLPNVDVQGGPSQGNENVSIRGLPQSHAFVSIDGIHQSNYATKRGSWYLNPEFIQRVQVTSGPTSGAAAGKISVSTISAQDFLEQGETFGSRINLGYRDNNGQQEGGLTLYGRHQQWDMLVSGQYSDYDPYHIGDNGDAYYKTGGRQTSGLMKIGNQVSDDQRLEFAYNYDKARSNQVRSDQGWRDEIYNGASLVWYDKGQGNPLLDFSASVYINNVDSYSWEGDLEEQSVQDIQDNSFGFSLANNSVVDLGGMSTVLHYGAMGHMTDHDGYVYDVIVETGELIDGSSTDEASTKSHKLAGWFNAQIALTEQWELIPGIRYDRFYIESSNAVDANGNPLLRDGRTESRWSKSLSTNYYLNDSLTLFASYAEALTAPRNGELFTSGRGFKPNPYLKSERSDNKELGLLWQTDHLWAEQDNFTARLNLFRNDIKDYIGTAYTDNDNYPDGVKVNIGEARLEGIELVTAYQLAQWSLELSYGQVRGTDETTGWYLTEMPSDKIQLAVDYDWSDELTVGGHYTYAFEHDKVPTQQFGEGGVIENIPPERADAWMTLDLYSRYEPRRVPGLGLSLSVTNLFDESYYLRPKFERNGSLASPLEFFEEGRSINLKLDYRF